MESFSSQQDFQWALGYSCPVESIKIEKCETFWPQSSSGACRDAWLSSCKTFWFDSLSRGSWFLVLLCLGVR
ncbi:hypothetical protein MTR_3g466560 [Medicago truncatula]|uniref:Uncharacterized protein n=1 Tax=Medicago truncatula TaxID=3880 RepID=A0A072UYE8_MEDTR|nr:hypothetical protein MTR_3g466560 [Medicago truncatula]